MSISYDPTFATFSLAIVIGVIGAFFGEFCSKLVYRLAKNRLKGVSVFSASFCPNCGKRLRFIDKIPIISYFFLKGKCRRCGGPISKRYLFFEITGLLLPFFLLWFDNFSLLSFLDYFLIMLLMTQAFIYYDSLEFSVKLNIFIGLLALSRSILLDIRVTSILLSFIVGLVASIFVLILVEGKKANKSTIILFTAYSLSLSWQNALITLFVFIILVFLFKLLHYFDLVKRVLIGDILIVSILINYLFQTLLANIIYNFLQFLIN